MNREITTYSDVPKVYWIGQRIGRSYVYVEQERPDDPFELPREIFLDAEGRNKASVRLEGRDAQTETEPGGAPPTEPDPLAEKRARLLGMPGILPHYIDESAVKALLETGRKRAGGAPVSGSDWTLADEMSLAALPIEQRALEAMKYLVAADEVLLDLELGLQSAPDLRNFQFSVKWLRSLGIDLAQAQVDDARARVTQIAARQILKQARGSAGRHVLIDGKFAIADSASGSGAAGAYRLELVHGEADRLGCPLSFAARLPRAGMHPAAKELYRARASRTENRSLALSLFGMVKQTSEPDGALTVAIEPIVVFTRG